MAWAPPMSLLERSAALAKSSSELKGLRDAANEADALRSRADGLTADLARLKAARTRQSLLARHRVAIDVKTGAAYGIAQFARDLEVRIAQAPAAILSPDLNVAPRLTAPLRTLIRDLDAAVAAAWQAYVLDLSPGIPADLLDVLGRIPGLTAGVGAVRDLLRRLEGLANTPPSSDEDVRLAQVVARQLNEAWRALDAAEMPAEVLAFLKETASSRGADLARLTPAVNAWLAGHGLTLSFKVATR